MKKSERGRDVKENTTTPRSLPECLLPFSWMSVIPVPFPCSKHVRSLCFFYLLVPSCIPAGLLGFRQNTSCPQVGEMERPYVQGYFCSNDDSQDGGETCIPSPHCLRSRTCHIICISLFLYRICNCNCNCNCICVSTSACLPVTQRPASLPRYKRSKETNPFFSTQRDDTHKPKRKPKRSISRQEKK